MLKNILEMIIRLQMISGKNDKQQFLKHNKQNKDFIQALRFLFDDFIVTGISKKKLNKCLKGSFDSIVKLDNFNQFIKYIIDNNTGKDRDIATIQQFINRVKKVDKLDEEAINILEQLITKKLKVGMTAKSFNKVFPEEPVRTFNVMLAKKYQEHKKKVRGEQFTLTQKFDGIRCILIKEKGITKAFSRKGKLITGIEHITTELDHQGVDNIMIDGELINDNQSISSDDNFRETQSKALSKTADKTNLKFYGFDTMPAPLFYRGGTLMVHMSRLKMLSGYLYGLKNIQMVKILYQGYDISQISKWMEHAEKVGWEGIMISLNKPYDCKRTHNLLKVKRMHSCDLKILGFQEGVGKFNNTLGAVIVSYKGHQLGVGSGFTDEMREEIWNHKDSYLNQIIEVQYFEESKDKNKKLSLRFPVFKRMRMDKTEESYN